MSLAIGTVSIFEEGSPDHKLKLLVFFSAVVATIGFFNGSCDVEDFIIISYPKAIALILKNRQKKKKNCKTFGW